MWIECKSIVRWILYWFLFQYKIRQRKKCTDRSERRHTQSANIEQNSERDTKIKMRASAARKKSSFVELRTCSFRNGTWLGFNSERKSTRELHSTPVCHVRANSEVKMASGAEWEQSDSWLDVEETVRRPEKWRKLRLPGTATHNLNQPKWKSYT